MTLLDRIAIVFLILSVSSILDAIMEYRDGQRARRKVWVYEFKEIQRDSLGCVLIEEEFLKSNLNHKPK